MRGSRAGEPPAVRIELENEWAWCGDRRLDLTPKAFAVLRHLVGRAARLVTKDELLATVWSDTAVSEATLTSAIRDLRRALADSSRTPRYIETVHRRGFRFIGPIASSAPTSPPTPDRPPASLVGREEELARLHALFAAACGRRRQVLFVTGEAGIGKTTLVEAFLARLDTAGGLRIGRGQCVEQYGVGEAYLPVLEALGRMGRDAGGEALVRILMQYAPTWLAQLPALLSDEDIEAVERRARGSTRERMLRELIEALDALAVDAPVVLVLEDLHWSDAATIDLLAMLARRRDPARLLVLGTYRPAEVAAGAHPLRPAKQELQVHGWCEELALDFLDEAAVREYLASRFPGAAFHGRVARVLHESTSGNPLFLVNLVDDLIAQGHVRDADGRWELSASVEDVAARVPHTLSQMVERQVDRLTPAEQAMLAVGSVAGAEFSAALATADGIEPREGEECCAVLARRGQLLRALGAAEWPDGTVAGRYGFIHALHRHALYDRVPVGHRVGLHLRIGDRLERAYGARAVEVAGELAMHFEHGRDLERAVRYHRHAADTALRQYGYREAVAHARRALELLATLPESTERSRQELPIQTVLGAAEIATNGWVASEVAVAYGRARELCAQLGVTPELFPVALGLSAFYFMRGEVRVAAEMTEQLLAVAEATNDAALLVGAYNTAGLVAWYRGEFVAALAHFERSMGIYDPERHSPKRFRAFSVDHDPGTSHLSHSAWTLSFLGYPDRAAARMRQCLDHARAIDHPVSLVMAYHYAQALHQFQRNRQGVRAIERVLSEHAAEHGLDLFLRFGDVMRGWLLAEDGHEDDGIALIRRGLATYEVAGAVAGTPTFLGILAGVCEKRGRAEEGLAAVSDALALCERTGTHYWDAELQRLRGALLLRTDPSQAEASLLEAIAIARRQAAKSFELRAATSLGRLWQRQGRTGEAHALLSDVYGWFSEGFETPDLIEARALLAGLEEGRRPA